MLHELIYTSARTGLRVGSRGFCTVAATRNVPQLLSAKLEALSSYRHIHPPQSPEAVNNPTAFSHVIQRVGSKTYHVVSRVADAGLDYSQRSNKLAHHLAFESGNLPGSDPVSLLANPGTMMTTWSGEPRTLDSGRSLPTSVLEPGACEYWREVTGDGGWGGALARTVSVHQPAVLIYKEGTDVLRLIKEAVALLPRGRRWQATFSTFFTTLPPDAQCLWRCVPANSAEAVSLRQAPNTLLVDLTQPLPAAAGAGLVDVARNGPQAGTTGSAASVGAEVSAAPTPPALSRPTPPSLPTSEGIECIEELVETVPQDDGAVETGQVDSSSATPNSPPPLPQSSTVTRKSDVQPLGVGRRDKKPVWLPVALSVCIVAILATVVVAIVTIRNKELADKSNPTTKGNVRQKPKRPVQRDGKAPNRKSKQKKDGAPTVPHVEPNPVEPNPGSVTKPPAKTKTKPPSPQADEKNKTKREKEATKTSEHKQSAPPTAKTETPPPKKVKIAQMLPPLLILDTERKGKLQLLDATISVEQPLTDKTSLEYCTHYPENVFLVQVARTAPASSRSDDATKAKRGTADPKKPEATLTQDDKESQGKARRGAPNADILFGSKKKKSELPKSAARSNSGDKSKKDKSADTQAPVRQWKVMWRQSEKRIHSATIVLQKLGDKALQFRWAPGFKSDISRHPAFVANLRDGVLAIDAGNDNFYVVPFPVEKRPALRFGRQKTLTPPISRQFYDPKKRLRISRIRTQAWEDAASEGAKDIPVDPETHVWRSGIHECAMRFKRTPNHLQIEASWMLRVEPRSENLLLPKENLFPMPVNYTKKAWGGKALRDLFGQLLHDNAGTNSPEKILAKFQTRLPNHIAKLEKQKAKQEKDKRKSNFDYAKNLKLCISFQKELPVLQELYKLKQKKAYPAFHLEISHTYPGPSMQPETTITAPRYHIGDIDDDFGGQGN